MIVNLPEDLESSIRAAVSSGRFVSEDTLVAEAVRAFLNERNTPVAMIDPPPDESSRPACKPIWELFQEISASVPGDEWEQVPTDLSEQHDHYIYGTPKHAVE